MFANSFQVFICGVVDGWVGGDGGGKGREEVMKRGRGGVCMGRDIPADLLRIFPYLFVCLLIQ